MTVRLTPLLPPLDIVRLVVVVAVLGSHVKFVPAFLSGGCRSSSHGVLRRRSVVCGINDKFAVVRLCNLVDIHLLGIVVNFFVLLLLGLVLLHYIVQHLNGLTCCLLGYDLDDIGLLKGLHVEV